MPQRAEIEDHSPKGGQLGRPAPGPRFWRSLEELADTDEFRAWVRNEYPADIADRLDGVSRREVLKLMAASFALAGFHGCGKVPTEQIVPTVRSSGAAPASTPLYFATAVTRDGFAQGVVVQSHAGRPTKVEGNPDHPAAKGSTDVFAQAAILTLYDPDRSQAVYHGLDISTWDSARAALSERIALARREGGRGLRLLTGPATSPTLQFQIRALLDLLPHAAWHVHSTIDPENRRRGARIAFGRETEMVPRVGSADIILSLDADFLYGFPGSVRHARDFADRRRMAAAERDSVRMNRLYVAEPCPSVTGANADHRLAVWSKKIEDIARMLLGELGVASLEQAPPRSDLPTNTVKWVRAVARDLLDHRGRGLVLAGDAQPPVVHAITLAINEHLGNLGRTIIPVEPFCGASAWEAKSLRQLTQDMLAGAVDTLLIVDANPAYDAPVDLAFVKAMRRVEFTAHMGLYRDETALQCGWHLPMAHEFESWSDARAFDGTVTILQPLIEPLYQGRTPHQLLDMLTGPSEVTGLEIVQRHWRQQVPTGDFEKWWYEVLMRGIVPDSAAKEVSRDINHKAIRLAMQTAGADHSTAESDGLFELNFQVDPTIGDGRFANNGWLQELPKPLTKLTWDNAVLLSAKNARELGAQNEDVLELGYRGARITGPAWIMPGHADECVTIQLGHGRTAAGSVGTGVGFSAYALRRSDAPWFDTGLRMRRMADRHRLACTQHHQLMENRDLVRVGNLEAFRRDPASLGRASQKEIHLSLYPQHGYEGQQWGMVINLSTCIGCNACTIACQAENNIPVVGKEQVRRRREMHWIRVDRYFDGHPESPGMHHQPVPCMHCENAPCELVCPVNATTHSHDGLNEMTYNRCVGTRYCANNCPYKVRRFNFLQYADLTTPSLMLQRNPEVSVRGRGVMEKCTYCVQRIRNAQIEVRKENRDLRDGEVLTACQQVCPTQAIVFGDIKDPTSRVSALRREPHNYALLDDLNTRPRTTYLARVRNPNRQLIEGIQGS